MSGEFAFIERVRSMAPAAPPGQVWIGDDCAVLDGGILLALDTMVEGTHFRLDWCSAGDAGWKALAVNVSDVAAMGGEPTACVVGLTVPTGSASRLADDAMVGVLESASAFGAPLVGGDTTSGGSALVISIAMLGRLPGNVNEVAPVLRSGARPGDTVFVTGSLGLAASALDALAADGEPRRDAATRLHRPMPRVSEGVAARHAGATSMIDVSDGLAADLGHICDASGVGVRLDATAIPIADGIDLERAITGGDDYELCFTAPDPDRVIAAFSDAGLSPPIPIGTVPTASDGRILLHPDAPATLLPQSGFQHSL